MVKQHPAILPEDRMLLMASIRKAYSTHTCPKCQGAAYCAMEDGKSASACWCMAIPVIEQAETLSSCLCKTCLVAGQNL